MHSLSIVIPLFNEIESVERLLERIDSAMMESSFPWELVLVDDGSTDGTTELVDKLIVKYGEHLHLLELQRNYGKATALQAGIDYASGDIIITMDADLQNAPEDIPRMAQELIDRDLDLLAGWRKDRKDALLLRKIPSRIANRLIANVTGIYLHDYGCGLQAYRSKLIRQSRLYGEMHRFIPAWIAVNTKPARIGETVVNHSPRQYGKSKYGLSRIYMVILDLISVYFFMRFRTRPGHFFGMLGLVSGFLSVMILSYLAIEKFVHGHDIGTRPLLLVGVVMLMASIQLITTGVLAEILTRTYFESTSKSTYIATPEIETKQVSWKGPPT